MFVSATFSAKTKPNPKRPVILSAAKNLKSPLIAQRRIPSPPDESAPPKSPLPLGEG